ncbi:DUF6516 family protein [Priestia megaterium]|uniref:toxin-antitoxin system TumE family protein n=1 Tax=Priestia megaterium TaxID=1404 RepID=UPI002E224129|nr:DUF6516 family protein [Priestia megaterium]
MLQEFERKKRINFLASQFSTIVEGPVNFVVYKRNRPKTGGDQLIAIVPFKNHETYGKTQLFINEEYFNDNNEPQYHYAWEKTKGSKHMKHISAWGNEPHEGYRRVNTEPYHHHHVPEEPAERQDCHHIQNLQSVLEFIKEYIENQVEYVPVET